MLQMDRDRRRVRPVLRFVPPAIGLALLTLVIVIVPGPARASVGEASPVSEASPDVGRTLIAGEYASSRR